MEVHNLLGHGFLEPVYHEALAIELSYRGILFSHEVELPISYRGQVLHAKYRVDFICFENVLVELKALARLSSIEESQVINYLKASSFQKALLINFLEYKRFVL